MQRKLLIYTILSALVPILAQAMDFGLRFNSHAFPLEKRTSLEIGDRPFGFESKFMVGFFFNFYTKPLFGTIATIKTDDGNTISAVASPQGDDKYMIGLVVNDHLKLMKGLVTLDPDREDHIDLSIDKTNGVAALRFNNDEIDQPVNLSGVTSASVRFGIDNENEMTDVAPIELRNIRIFIDNQNTNHWDFKYHDTPTTCIDGLEGIQAKVTNPHWLIDDHTDWTLIYSKREKDHLQTAFDPRNENFYIVGDNKITVFSPLTSDSLDYPVNGGKRVMAYSNHLMFDTVSGSLINYNLSKRSANKFDFNTRSWTPASVSGHDDEPNYSNHAFAIDKNAAYTFGGYGFYKFHNDLFKINLSDGHIEECRLTPEMMPLTSSSATVVDGKLYIFGGKGNDSGRQELPSKYRYSLYAYDTQTWNGELVWELDSVEHQFLPSQTMFYEPSGDCFYVAITSHGGKMVKIGKSKPSIDVVSTPINARMEYHDCVFDLFRSADGKHFYLVFDRRMDPYVHDYSIYTISTPFIDDISVINNKSLKKDIPSGSSGNTTNMIFIIVIILIILVAGFVIIRKHRAKGPVKTAAGQHTSVCENTADDRPDKNEVPVNSSDIEQETGNHDEKVIALEPEEKPVADSPVQTATEELKEPKLKLEFDGTSPKESHYDRSRSSISLLGGFSVRSKTGEDVTMKFTSRLKSLLILMLLQCHKNETGIKYQTIDELIWSDKDEKSAQNNRNVYMRKLRLLLEEIGDIPVTYDKGYFMIDTSAILFDYKEAMNHISTVKSNTEITPQLIEETLELLLMGPLLPSTSYEWLDNFKADYSDSAIELLHRLLDYEINRGDGRLAYRIAETISLHEPLSEEAMKVKCRLLSKKKMPGLAQNVYNRFCKEYEHSMGEPYAVSFVDVCRE